MPIPSNPHRNLRVALVYPNSSKVGGSNLGFLAVRSLLRSLPGVVCETAFFGGRNASGRRGGPATEESGTALSAFDAVAFSVSYEGDLIHAVAMLANAGIPIRAEERSARDPAVVFGGIGVAANPEPASAAADLIVLGDAEATVPALVAALSSAHRRDALESLAAAGQGFYVPALYRAAYDVSLTKLIEFEPLRGAPPGVRPAVRLSTQRPPHQAGEGSPFSGKRLIEIARGCGRGCRFCGIGFRERPPVFFPKDRILSQALSGDERSVGLIAPSPGDHADLAGIVDAVSARGRRVSLSSLRIDAVTPALARSLIRAGCRSVTLAPEAGSDRLRRVVNKAFDDAAVVLACRTLLDAGIQSLKLYFMAGLPTETDDDVLAVADLVSRVHAEQVASARPRGRIGRVRVSIGIFVPKPHTPFQWEPLADRSEVRRRLRALRRAFSRLPNVVLETAARREAETEALLSVGGRPVGDLLVRSALEGGTLLGAASRAGFDLDAAIYSARALDARLPWDFIDTGVEKEYLWKERENGMAGRVTAPCPPDGCTRCGVCG